MYNYAGLRIIYENNLCSNHTGLIYPLETAVPWYRVGLDAPSASQVAYKLLF